MKHRIQLRHGYGGPYLVLKGIRSRVQLEVCDLTGADVHENIRQPVPSFTVRELAARFPPSTPFTRGALRYHGTDETEALVATQTAFGWEIDPETDFPPSIRRYFE